MPRRSPHAVLVLDAAELLEALEHGIAFPQDVDLAELLKAFMRVTGSDEGDVSGIVGIGSGTVRRWVAGRSSSHPQLRPATYRALASSVRDGYVGARRRSALERQPPCSQTEGGKP